MAVLLLAGLLVLVLSQVHLQMLLHLDPFAFEVIFLFLPSEQVPPLRLASELPGAGVGSFGAAFGGLALPVVGEYSIVLGVFACAEPDALAGVLGGALGSALDDAVGTCP